MLSISTLELVFRTPPRGVLVATLLAMTGAANTPPQRIKIEVREWKIALAADSVASGPVTLQVHNAGTIAHVFEIEGNGTEKRTAPIPADSSATLSVTLKPGHYQIYCPLAGGAHKKMGMVADLAVHSTM